MKSASLFMVLALTVCGCDNLGRSTSSGNTNSERDNSAVNQRDRSGTSKTPLDQNENQKDIDITANIRKQVVDTKMSVNAQNVKIVTQDGQVTLRGPVATTEEKVRIEVIARKVAGETKIDSQLEVASSN
jgi:hyperosmotically inducible periplasmic protein